MKALSPADFTCNYKIIIFDVGFGHFYVHLHIMDELKYIKKCLELIEDSLRWRDRSTWVYDDFKRLQKLIFDASGTSLSVHTLERLFGKLKTHKNYNPQKETKNALAVFLNYEDWEDFKDQNQLAPHAPDQFATTGAAENRTARKTGAKLLLNKKVFMVVGLIIISICGGYVALNTFDHHKQEKLPAVDLQASNVYGVRPHTVKFTFNLSNLDVENISIDFGIGRSLRNISKKQTHLYKTYLKPGIYEAQLMGDGKVLGTTSIFIDMKAWQAYTYTVYEDPETRKAIPDSIVSKDGRLYTPHSKLKSFVEPNKHYFVEYFKVGDFGVKGDNMTFETRFRNNHHFDYQICFDMFFKLIGTNGILKMHFLKSGCAGFVQMIYGEKQPNGHKQDLSVFTQEFHDWKTARMEVKDKVVNIYFGDQLIYTTSYHQPVGNIYAISITSKGTGQTDHVKLFDEKQQLMYSDYF